MEKNTHSIVIWPLICAVSVIVLLAMFVQMQQSSTARQASFQNLEATVAFDYGNGKMREFEGPVGENANVWDAFQQAIAAGGISIEISDHFVPRIIDGLENGAGGKYWNLYVNGVRQEVSPFEIGLKAGDKAVFRFE